MDYDQIRRQCEMHARRKGFAQDAEDFASDVILDLIEHDRTTVFIGRRFVDYLRRNYGRTGIPSGDAKSRHMLCKTPIDSGTIGSDTSDRRDTVEVARILSQIGLTEKQLQAATDHMVFGKSKSEIAKEMGTSAASVHDKIRAVTRKLNPNALAATLGSEGIRLLYPETPTLEQVKKEHLEKVFGNHSW